MTAPSHLLVPLHTILGDAELVIQFIPNTPIRLWLISAHNMQQRIFDGGEISQILQQPPYWCFCWSSGVALCQWLLVNSQQVMGKRVLDFGAGSGCVAIAAKKAGASKVTVCDLDPVALDACRANALLNGVELDYLTDFNEITAHYDLIMAADILYDKENMKWLDIFPQHASFILVADSRVKNFQHKQYQLLSQLNANTIPDLSEPLEFCQVKLYQSICYNL